MSPILGTRAGASVRGYGFTAAAPILGDYESIATYSPSGVSTVTFSSIPQTYAHLQLRIIANKASVTDWLGLRFNGTSGGTAYNSHMLTGNGSSASAGFYGSMSEIYAMVAPSNASYFGAGIFDILDYTSTNKTKVTRSLNGYDLNGSGEIRLISGLWNDTSAISSIEVRTGSNYTTGTSIALYGIKG